VTLLNSPDVAVRSVLLDEIVPGKHVNLRFHPTLMAASGKPAVEILLGSAAKKDYVLVVEGAVSAAEGGAFGGVGEKDGKHIPMTEAVTDLAKAAVAVIALGSCAAYGGIPAGEPNVTGCRGVSEYLKTRGVKTPVVNVPGCPPHPDWFVGTVAGVLLGGLAAIGELDEIGRPKLFYGELIHENCPRRPDFDAGKFARKIGDSGCLYLVGCKGPVTSADCPKRMWNGGTNWCVGANGPCSGCVEPEFPDKFSPLYEKITEERLSRFRAPAKGK